MDRDVIDSAFTTLEAAGCRPPATFQSSAARDQAITLWCELLHECDPNSLRKAVTKYLLGPESQYWPTPGLLLQLMEGLNTAEGSKATEPTASPSDGPTNAPVNDEGQNSSAPAPEPTQAANAAAPEPAPVVPTEPVPTPTITPPPKAPASRPPGSSRSLFGKKRSRARSKGAFSFPPQASPVAAEPALPPSMKPARPAPVFDPLDLPDLPGATPPEVSVDTQAPAEPLPAPFPADASQNEAATREPSIDFEQFAQGLPGAPEFEQDFGESDNTPTEIDEKPIVDTAEITFDDLPIAQEVGETQPVLSETESAPSATDSLPASFGQTFEENDSNQVPLTLPTLAPTDLDEIQAEIPATDEIPNMVTIGEMGAQTQNVSQMDDFAKREITEWDEDEFDRELSEMQRLRAASNKQRMRLIGAIGVTALAAAALGFFVLSGQPDVVDVEEPRKTARALKEEAQANAIELAASAPDLSKEIKDVAADAVEPSTTTAPTEPSAKANPTTEKAPASPKPAPAPPKKAAPKPAPPSPSPAPVAKAPAPTVVPKPQPTITKAPSPAPVASASSASLIDRGWENVESNPAQAAKYFKQAIDRDSGDYDANLGYGYVLMKQGNLEDAGRYLCRARRSPSVETQREARQFLLNNGLTCN